MSFLFCTSYNLLNGSNAMTVEPFIDTITHFQRYGWVEEVGRSDFNSRSTGHHKLDSISSRTNTAQTYNRYLNRTGNLPDHAQSHRLHGGA